MEHETESAVVEHQRRIQAAYAEGSTYWDLPGRHITPNQLVSYNMAYFRKVARLTQAELAARLNAVKGDGKAEWTNASVSAAERSWDGKRIRQFDADALLSLATTLRVPVSAFFLPPEDDGVHERYLMDLPAASSGGDSECFHMDEILQFACSTSSFTFDDEEDDDDDRERARSRAVNERYDARARTALGFYMGTAYVADSGDSYADVAWGTSDGESIDTEMIVEKLERAHRHYESLRQLLGDIEEARELLYRQLGEAKDRILPPRLKGEVIARFRAGENVQEIAKRIGEDPWIVEKALIAEREGYLVEGADGKTRVFVRAQTLDELREKVGVERAEAADRMRTYAETARARVAAARGEKQ